ncbi:MAG: hypothetical protein ACTSXA_02980 [Candidatus Heimdallarchaeota archaeon]
MAVKKKKTKDFIEKDQELIVTLNPKQMQIVNKYGVITAALRDKVMTVKEIHDLFYDEETKKHRYALKTIYRHLEILEEENLVIVVGHRVTEGSRVLEKLYARRGNIFFLEMDEEYRKYKQKYYDKMLKNLHTVFCELYDKPDLDLEKFREVLMPFFKKAHSEADELMRLIPENANLTELYKKIDIESVNVLNSNMSMFKTFLANPEILEKLRKLLDTK